MTDLTDYDRERERDMERQGEEAWERDLRSQGIDPDEAAVTDLTPEREQELRRRLSRPDGGLGPNWSVREARDLLAALDTERARAKEAIREADGMARAPYGEFIAMRERMEAAEARNRNLEAAAEAARALNALHRDVLGLPTLSQDNLDAAAAAWAALRAALAVLEEPREKDPCLYPLDDGGRCLECDACQGVLGEPPA